MRGETAHSLLRKLQAIFVARMYIAGPVNRAISRGTLLSKRTCERFLFQGYRSLVL